MKSQKIKWLISLKPNSKKTFIYIMYLQNRMNFNRNVNQKPNILFLKKYTGVLLGNSQPDKNQIKNI